MKDHLLLWNDGETKRRIVAFVEAVTTPGSGSFVPSVDRIATFDNDGCLWAEQPAYFQALFAVDQVQQMAPEHPEWQDDAVLKSAIDGDFAALAAFGEQGILRLMGVTHAGMTTDAFDATAAAWFASAQNPLFHRRYVDCIYAPMLELLHYLRQHDFSVFIISGGGIDFMRVYARDSYGFREHEVMGSTGGLEYQLIDGVGTLLRLPAVAFINDGPGKPVGIHHRTGKRPIFACGNSDGDYEMLEYTTTGDGPRFGMLIHHDDAAREVAYDRDSHVGQLARGLDDAERQGWVIASMTDDFRVVFP